VLKHDDPTTVLKGYFNTAVQRYFQFLRDNGHNSPRDFKYIIEAHNNEDPNRTQKYCVSGFTGLGETNNSICIR
jgi:hypothetical protein